MIHEIFEIWFREKIALFQKFDELSLSSKAEVIGAMAIVNENIIEEVLENQPWVDKFENIWENREKNLLSPAVQAIARIENTIISKEIAREIEKSIFQICVLNNFIVIPTRVEKMLLVKIKSARDVINQIRTDPNWLKSLKEMDDLVKFYEEKAENIFISELEKKIKKSDNSEEGEKGIILKIDGSPIEELTECYKFEVDSVINNQIECAVNIIQSKSDFDKLSEGVKFFKIFQTTSGCTVYRVLSWFWGFITRMLPAISTRKFDKEILSKFIEANQSDFDDYLMGLAILFRALGHRHYQEFTRWLKRFIRQDILKYDFDSGEIEINNALLKNSLARIENSMKMNYLGRNLWNKEDWFCDDEDNFFSFGDE